jgi:hypothetical protein
LANRVGFGFEAQAWPAPLPHRVSAFVPIWRRPWMALGQPTYGSSLLSHLGVANVFSDDGPYPVVHLDDVLKRFPDAILIPSEPYSFRESHIVELRDIAPTVLIDGKDLFWWGVRTLDALSRFAIVLRSL